MFNTEESKACELCKLPEKTCINGYLITNDGFTKCPHKEKEGIVAIEDIPAEIEIPEIYKNEPLSMADLQVTLMKTQSPLTTEKFMQSLNEILESIREGSLSHSSYLIHIPQDSGINDIHLVYQFMVQALVKGLTATPFYDSYVFDYFSKHYRYNVEGNKRFPITYDDYLNKDICFIKYRAGVVTNRDIQIVNNLIDQRAMLGLATFVISPYNLDYLISAEQTIEGYISKDDWSVPNKMKYVHLDSAFKSKASRSKEIEIPAENLREV